MSQKSEEKPVYCGEPMDWSFSIINANTFSIELAQFYSLYQRSFVLQPEMRAAIIQRFEKHMQRKNFAACVVRSQTGELAGFSYGFEGAQGEWWHDRVRGNLSSDMAMEWMTDSFEMAEVAVDPDFQGRGVGAVLVSELRRHARASTVLLTVRIDNIKARKLYDRMGFVVLIESLFFPGDEHAYAVMGYQQADLTLESRKLPI